MAADTGAREIDEIAAALCRESALNGVWRPAGLRPSVTTIAEISSRLKAAIFPGYFGGANYGADSLRFHLAANLDSVRALLADQILAGLCFDCAGSEDGRACADRGREEASIFIRKIPEIRRLLAGDVRAAFEGDPAAKSPGEAIFCYPSITAMFHHRVAHELYLQKIPIVPRIISEMAHSETGIDIHPGASIGEDFFIDHGTGVVIGETCVIGKGCRLYQGVTLGALSFPKNPDGVLVKGVPRHPILEDNVTVYAGATILGRITVGAGAVIGGNVWVTENVPPGARITQRHETS